VRIVHDSEREREVWRDGVETRMYVSAITGAGQLTVFEQWCAPGHGAPSHLHAVEEVLRILGGQADVWVGEDRATLGPGSSVIIPAGAMHGFSNTGDEVLHVQAILAAPIFEAHYVENGRDSRRWGPQD
jgi:mannose-6-phosphate isomerase-like protein (cupin superfamily)